MELLNSRFRVTFSFNLSLRGRSQSMNKLFDQICLPPSPPPLPPLWTGMDKLRSKNG